MHKACLIVVLVFFPTAKRSCFAQTVTTLPVPGLNGPNGFAIDKKGRLYIANEAGKKVVRIVNDSVLQKVIDCDSPDGLTFDDIGNLYICNFYSGVILRKTNHSVDTFVTGLEKPADIKWDGKGNLFVSEYERGTIKKISLGGETTEFVSGLKLPFGLIFDNDSNLYAAENVTGIIKKIGPHGVVTFFAQIPGSITYLAYSNKTGRLYAPCLSKHSIYAINKNGKVELIAGSGEGDRDGKLKEAQFKSPNSIAISADGDLYISEFYINRIRKIIKIEN